MRASSANFPEKLDRFAALLEQDLPISVIAQRMGVSRGAAQNLLIAIRKRLGPQAV